MKNFLNPFLGSLAFIAITHAAQAASVTWNLGTGGTWDTSTGNWSGGSPTGNLYVNGDTANFTNTAGGTITLSGTIAPAATNVSAASGTYTFDGAGITSGTLTKSGAGTLILSGSNTYSGSTIIRAGSLSLSGSSGTISNSAITISGGTLKLDNTNTANNTDRISDSLAVNMNGGTFNFSNNANAVNYSESAGTLTISSGGNTVSTSQAAAGQTSTLTFTGLSRAGGVIDFTGTGLGTNSQNRVILTSNPTLSAGIIGNWATYGSAGWASYDATNGVIALATYTDINALGSTIADGGTTNVRLNAAGSGSNIALGATTTTINTLLQNTTTAATVDTASKTLRTSGIMIGTGKQALKVGVNAGDGTLTAATAGGSLSLINKSSNGLTINAAIANHTSASSLITNGNVTLAGVNTYTGPTDIAGGTLTLTSGSAQGLGGNISGTGALTLNNSTGTLTLSGTNAYTGQTTVTNGTLILANGSAIADTATVNLANTSTAKLQLNASETIGSLTGGGTNGGNVDLGGNTLTVYLAANYQAPTYTGGISNGSLTLSGVDNTGTFRLSGTNTYTGDTVISAGRLRVSNATTNLPSASLVKAEGGQFFTNIAGPFTNDFHISGNGFLETDGTQLGAIRGDNSTFSGTITLSGAARIGVGSGTVAVTSTYNGKITGNYALDFYSANQANGSVGTFVLSNTGNDWGGDTTIYNRDVNIATLNAGNPFTGGSTTLKLGASGVLPNGTGKGILTFTGVDIQHKTILEMNGFNETINGLSVTGSTAGAIIQNSTGSSTLTIGDADTTSSFSGSIINNGGTLAITKIGTGMLTLSGTNTYTGGTTVSGGSLVISGNSSSANGAVSVDAGSLYVSGQLGGNVTVAHGATIGSGIDVGVGAGVLGGTLTLNGTSTLDLTNLNGTADLSALSISFASGGFGVDNLTLGGAAINWDSVANGTYTLLAGTLNSSNLDNFGYVNRVAVGSMGREAYFQNGSLQLVVIPEPRAALLGGLGTLLLLRRRRVA